jgi:uncharacterized membrane protein YoaK (UPF0700 family)
MLEDPAPTGNRKSVWITMIALLVWAVLMAAGTFLHSYRSDIRKPLIVLAFMLTFLLVWIILLAFKRKPPRTKT